MTFKSQTAIRGVFSVGLINMTGHLIAYGKHIVITAFIGFSAQLDAFYVATTVLAMVIFVFGDVFDSVGIPHLVKTLQTEGEEKFKELAGSILTLAFFLAVGLGIVLLLIAPWTPWIAPGFSPEKKGFVLQNLVFLAPMIILYLPYHAIGSFLRAKRRFQAFYMGEIIIATVTLGIVFLWYDLAYVLPISFSVAYIVAFLYAVFIGRREILFPLTLRGEKIWEIIRMLFRLLPIYLVFPLFTLADRTFASFLPTGGVSALSYGLMIVLIPGSILMMENVFIIPLSESSEKGAMMKQILKGVLIISVPIAFFTTAYADQIVKAAFERGAFTASSTQMTGDALSFLALGIPAFFIWPICYRLFQILRKLGKISILAYCAVVLNGILNFLFMKMGLGIKGLALATSISNYGLALGSAIVSRQVGISIVEKETLSVLLISLGVSTVALSLTLVIPAEAQTVEGLFLRSLTFSLTVAMLFYLVPNEDVRFWRETVLREILPKKN